MFPHSSPLSRQWNYVVIQVMYWFSDHDSVVNETIAQNARHHQSLLILEVINLQMCLTSLEGNLKPPRLFRLKHSTVEVVKSSNQVVWQDEEKNGSFRSTLTIVVVAAARGHLTIALWLNEIHALSRRQSGSQESFQRTLHNHWILIQYTILILTNIVDNSSTSSSSTRQAQQRNSSFLSLLHNRVSKRIFSLVISLQNFMS